MDKLDTVTSNAPQTVPSREELEQHLRARTWKDDAFRQEFLANPKAVLERDYAQYFPEGKIPSGFSIQVIEEEEQAICFVLPSKSDDDHFPKVESIEDEDILDVSGGAYSDWCTKDRCTYIVCITSKCDSQLPQCDSKLASAFKRIRL
jgi:hypothetical protein